MTIDMYSYSHNAHSPLASGTLTEEQLALLVEDALAIAGQEQIRITLADESIDTLRKSSLSSSQVVALEKPTQSSHSGDFYESIISALSNLAGLMGDMVDNIQTDLMVKRDEAKRLLEEKVRLDKENKKREAEALEAFEKVKEHEKASGIFGRITNFLFSAVQFVGGAVIGAVGAATGNVAMMAGGASMAIAGTLGAVAEIVSIAGGDVGVQENLKKASMGFFVAGVTIASYGVFTSAGAGASFNAFAVGASGIQASTYAYSIHAANYRHEYEVQKATLDFQIAELKAKVVEVTKKQELMSDLIDIIVEHLTRGVVAPIEEAFKILNQTIQDRERAAKNISVSMSV